MEYYPTAVGASEMRDLVEQHWKARKTSYEATATINEQCKLKEVASQEEERLIKLMRAQLIKMGCVTEHSSDEFVWRIITLMTDLLGPTEATKREQSSHEQKREMRLGVAALHDLIVNAAKKRRLVDNLKQNSLLHIGQLVELLNQMLP